ncbi:MAG TPA: divalent metal cation transporter [Patescibacteria group bacterium]
MSKEPIAKQTESPLERIEESVESAEKTVEKLIPKKEIKEAKDYWKLLGPGLTTGASDDDPSGIATYSQTGAQYGFQLLWFAPITFPLMSVVQEMCARIGLVTGRGLAANIRRHYPRWVLYTTAGLLFFANTLNIGANLGAMAKAGQLLLPNLSFTIFLVFFTSITLLLQIFSTYEKYARYLKYLAFILFSYIASALLSKLDWSQVLNQAIIPSITFSKEQIFLICAILGTTISPYLFFWQTSQEVEEQILEGETSIASRIGATPKAVKRMRIDVWSGMFLSNIVMFFIIAASAATLFANGITDITTAADAASALRPLAGDAAYLLFAIGIVGTGLLAVPVLAGSASYAMSESLGWKEGLFRKFKQAHGFYGVIIISMLIGLIINFTGIDPMKALIYSAVANGLVAPVVLIQIVLISSNLKIMGKWASGRLNKSIGYFITAAMTLAGAATILTIFI